jgi:hypothetical protein
VDETDHDPAADFQEMFGVPVDLQKTNFVLSEVNEGPVFESIHRVVGPPAGTFLIRATVADKSARGIADLLGILREIQVGFAVIRDRGLTDEQRVSLEGEDAEGEDAPTDDLDFELSWLDGPDDGQLSWAFVVDPIKKKISGDAKPHKYRSNGGEPCEGRIRVNDGVGALLARNEPDSIAPTPYSRYSEYRTKKTLRVDGLKDGTTKYTFYGTFHKV